MKNNRLFWIYVLSGTVYFTQGIEGLPNLALFAFMKEKLHFNPSTIMYIGALTSLAWLIKPLIGFLSDNFLSKKLWINLSLIGSLLICLFLGLSPIIPLFVLIPILMLANWNAATRDVNVDGIMCVEGKEMNECSSIQSIQWIMITIASIIVGLFGGYIADHYSYQLGYLCLIPIYLIILGIVSKYKEINPKKELKKAYKASVYQYKKEILDKKYVSEEHWNKYPLAAIFLQLFYCLYNINPTFYETFNKNLKSYKELFTNKQFLLGCLFLFVYKFAPGFGTPLSFIERDQFKWSFTFMSILGAIASVVSIIGAIIYYKINKKINVKKCLFYSVFLVGITNLCYLYFTPITDIVYTLLFSFLGMLIFLNTMSWMAKSTLPGKEATSFALLCSISNLSGTLSTITGAWLFPILGLKTIIIVASCSAFLSLPILKRLEIK